MQTIKELLKPVAEALIQYRKSERYSQEEIATKAGLSAPTIQALEYGNGISLPKLLQICEAIECKITIQVENKKVA